MERTQIFDLMGELKLYVVKAAFDEIMATAVKREHEPKRIVGDLVIDCLELTTGPGSPSGIDWGGLLKSGFVHFWRIVLKNSNITGLRDLANDACWRFQPL